MRFRLVLVSLIMVLLTLSAVAAQQPVTDCPAIVETALSNLVNQCGATEGLSACYAHQGMNAALADASQPVTFNAPGDRAPLAMLKSLTGSPADLTNKHWGVAILNLSPFAINDTSGQSLASMLLLGDMTLENTDDSDQAPMQSIRLTSGSGEKACPDIPNALAIYTHLETSLGFSVNGVNLRLPSLVVFQLNSANSLTATVQSGQLEVINGPTAQTGQTLAAVMDNTGTILFWSAPRAANADEIRTLNVITSAFGKLGSVVSVFPPVTATVIPAAVTNASQPQATPFLCSTTHVVQAGENLFRIALRYGADFDAVAAANGLASPYLIHPGQQLVIPCGS